MRVPEMLTVTGSMVMTMGCGIFLLGTASPDSAPDLERITSQVPAGAPTGFKFYYNASSVPAEPADQPKRQMYIDDLTLTGAGAGETLSAIITITRADVPEDSNGDGVPDAWLSGYGRDPSTPGGDTAPNGYTYLESYLMDLDPDDTALPPIQMEPGSAAPFTFGAPTNRRYMVQYTSNLYLPFEDVGEGVDVGEDIEINGDLTGFYRVRFYDETGENETVTVSATPGSTTFTNAAGIEVTLNVSGVNVVTSTYAVAGGAPAGFTNGQVVTIGTN